MDELTEMWLDAGFSQQEAQELTNAPSPDAVFDSIPGALARESRRNWIEELENRGWTRQQINAEIEAYYTRAAGRTPWDFIRAEYKSVHKLTSTQYEAAARKRAEHNIQQLYGG